MQAQKRYRLVSVTGWVSANVHTEASLGSRHIPMLIIWPPPGVTLLLPTDLTRRTSAHIVRHSGAYLFKASLWDTRIVVVVVVIIIIYFQG